MNVVKTMTIPGAPEWMSCTPTNCAEPAKTMDDIAIAAPTVSPAPMASTP